MCEVPETHTAPATWPFWFPSGGQEVSVWCQELEVPYGNHTAAMAALNAHARAVAGDQAERVVRTLQHTVTALVPTPWACPFPERATRGSRMNILWSLRHTRALACIEVGECMLCLVDHRPHVHYLNVTYTTSHLIWKRALHCIALHVSRCLPEARHWALGQPQMLVHALLRGDAAAYVTHKHPYDARDEYICMMNGSGRQKSARGGCPERCVDVMAMAVRTAIMRRLSTWCTGNCTVCH